MNKEYKKYLKSKEWGKIRNTLFDLRGYKCEECENNQFLHIHHKTYKNIFNEKLKDLQILCSDCHYGKHYKKIEAIKSKNSKTKILKDSFKRQKKLYEKIYKDRRDFERKKNKRERIFSYTKDNISDVNIDLSIVLTKEKIVSLLGYKKAYYRITIDYLKEIAGVKYLRFQQGWLSEISDRKLYVDKYQYKKQLKLVKERIQIEIAKEKIELELEKIELEKLNNNKKRIKKDLENGFEFDHGSDDDYKPHSYSGNITISSIYN